MSGKFKVVAPIDRVSRAEYLDELLRSKIVVSPFGYGEICWRDFEAIICGAVLFKPDMSHVQTRPNVFIPYITYVPLKWDYSDLEEKSEYYLQNKEKLVDIATGARSLLLSSMRPIWFLESFRELLVRAGLSSGAGRSSSS
jgi:hypothetical protein